MHGRVDFHIHSTASDGTLTPTEIAREAKAKGLCAAALTDHDTVSGVSEFLVECERLGVKGIAGTELSAKFDGEMHIVGLFVDHKNEDFLSKLYHLEHAREIRNKKMIERCNALGFDITAEELISQKQGGNLDNVGRPHFARIFVDKGYAKDIADAFDKYFAKGRLCYCGREMYSPMDTIDLVHIGGGIAVLAHPMFVTRDTNRLRELLLELKNYGLDGMECRHSEMDKEFSVECEKLCDALGLLKSGGSDFHGSNKDEIEMGTGKGELRVPEEYLMRMYERNK